MTVLMVHYHLKPGGVSTVIKRQARALAHEGIACGLLVGEAPEGVAPASLPGFAVEPALAYDPPADRGAAVSLDAPGDDPRIGLIKAAVEREARALGPDAVIHVHNPTLAKNAALLPALAALAKDGYPILMHVHDLAEDWRPELYRPVGYPEGCAWAAINGRDAARLKEAGAGLVAFLPNPVFSDSELAAYARSCNEAPPKPRRDGKPDASTLIYPVRGIRRKNLGEALLVARYLPAGMRLAVTLPPNSERDMPYYEAWVSFAARLGLAAEFGAGLRASLDENYARAAAVFTSSIKEGFGLSYLEPLARRKPVLGRRLAQVCDDFESGGLRFGDLYDELRVPEGLCDLKAMAARARADAARCARAFGLGDGAALADSVERLFVPGCDYGRLDEAAQAELIGAIARDPGAMQAFAETNPWLQGLAALAGPQADGQGCVAPGSLSLWSERRYGRALREAYESLFKAKALGRDLAPPDTRALAHSYLTPEQYYAVGL
jgi:glycosyltransferase involved in cell wall biosynthesis